MFSIKNLCIKGDNCPYFIAGGRCGMRLEPQKMPISTDGHFLWHKTYLNGYLLKLIKKYSSSVGPKQLSGLQNLNKSECH